MTDPAAILVVEDDVIIAMRLQDTLESWGYTTYACHSGSKAVELAQQVTLDLALMDINLNGKMDGVQTAEALRKLDCPSIFLTAYSDDALLERAKLAEPYGYLVKPVYDRELRSTVEMALVKQRSDRQVRDSERRLRAVFECAGVGMALVNTQTGDLVMANARLWEIIGIPADEAHADFIWKKYTHPDDVLVQEALMGQLVGGEIRQFSLEKRYLTPERGQVWVNLTTSATWDAGEAPSLHVSVVEDITARKLADEALRLRVAELEGMNRISGVLRSADDLDSALPALMDELLHIVQAKDGAIILYKDGQPGLDAAVTRGWLASQPDLFERSELLPGLDLMAGSGMRLGDFKDYEHPMIDRAREIQDMWSAVVLPVQAGGAALGVTIVSTLLPRRLRPEEVRLLETMTAMAGSAIQRIRLHDQQRRNLERIEALHQIDNAIRSNMDMASTLQVVLEHACLQLGADAAAVLLADSEKSRRLMPTSEQGFRTVGARRPPARIGEGLAGRSASECTRLVGSYQDFSGEPERRRVLFVNEGFRQNWCAPLVANERLLGVLEVFFRHDRPIHPDRMSFLDVLAGQAAMAVAARQLIARLQSSNGELRLAYHETIEGWSRAMDLRDKETEGHTRRVTEVTVELAQRMGFSDEKIEHMRRGALLHDIGKIGVPDHILLKQGPLTDEEWVVMRTHPQWAYDLIAPIEYLRQAVDIPYCHHERWDGTGYPRGLKGEEIPAAARVFSVVDVYDALTSDRPYRAAWSLEKTLAYLQENSGTMFEPAVVEEFQKMIVLPEQMAAEQAVS